jgi:preprotein translocase subunit YajC
VLGLFIPLNVTTSSGSGSAGFVVFLVLMAGLFYFLMIRPQQRRARSQRQMIEGIDVGDEVMTIGGVYGTVQSLDDESFTLEVSPGVDIRFVKSAIARKLVYDEEEEDEDERQDEEEEAGDQS